MSPDAAPRGRLPESAMKEQLSIAYLHMTATAAGCTLHRWDTDYDSVDVTVYSSAGYARQSAARVDVQLKCTADVSGLTEDHLPFSLSRKNYLDLSDHGRDVPAVLAVLVIPSDPQVWLTHDEEQLLVRSRMYWDFASAWSAIEDGQDSKTVHLPRANLLTVDSLLRLLQTSAQRRT